jgi:hypothetical protein
MEAEILLRFGSTGRLVLPVYEVGDAGVGLAVAVGLWMRCGKEAVSIQLSAFSQQVRRGRAFYGRK